MIPQLHNAASIRDSSHHATQNVLIHGRFLPELTYIYFKIIWAAVCTIRGASRCRASLSKAQQNYVILVQTPTKLHE